MDLERRKFIKFVAAASALATLGLAPLRALAAFTRPQKAFDATELAATFAALGPMPVDSDDINLQAPDIAENGAVVPVGVTSKIPNSRKIYILIAKNPNPLSAVFQIPDGTEAFVQTRVKVAQTCKIYAVVEADGKLYKTAKETKVTLGGCGG